MHRWWAGLPELYHVRNDCRLCGSKVLHTVLALTDCPAGDSLVPESSYADSDFVFPLTVISCGDCRNVQLREVVAPEYLYGKYTYNTAVSMGLADHFDEYAAAILAEYRPAAGALVVDIGSNDGTLLKSFAARGMNVTGVEPAAGVAQTANGAGVKTINAFFDVSVAEDIARDSGPAAIITANNVMANIDDLGGLFEAITALLASDGVFVFETGYVADQINDALFDNIYHEHLSYFAVAPLVRFLERKGLEMVGATRVSTKGGSIRCVVQRAGGPRPASESVAKIAGEELAGEVGFPAEFMPLSDLISDARTQLLDSIKSYPSGTRFAGYGASVGAITMLYHFGLGEHLEYIIDDDPLKQGMLTPGHRIPVLPPTALNQNPPDVLVILAWRYADAIMKNRRSFSDRGGLFLIPWPKLKIS
jgi:SAM-dependent methyltransferase